MTWDQRSLNEHGGTLRNLTSERPDLAGAVLWVLGEIDQLRGAIDSIEDDPESTEDYIKDARRAHT